MKEDDLLEHIRRLSVENDELKEQIKDIRSDKRQRRRNSLRYKISKKFAYIFMGRGLKNSINQLYTELPGPVKKDTFADVSAHLIWRITRVGIFAFIVGVTPLLILVTQTIILNSQNNLLKTQVDHIIAQNQLIDGQNKLITDQNKLFLMQNQKADVTNDLVEGQNSLFDIQNSMFDNQNQLVEKQTDRIEQQTELIEADRRSSLVFLMGNIMDRVDDELKEQKGKSRTLSFELMGRISALSQSLKPYRYLKNNRLTKKPLSPERGQLLLSLVNTKLDTVETYPNLYISTKLSRADLDEAILRGAFLKGARLNNADLSDADLNGANCDEATLTDAEMKEVAAIGASFKYANLSEADMRDSDFQKSNFEGALLEEANLEDAELRSANLSEANFEKANLKDADLSETNLSGAKFKKANMTNVRLDFAKVDSKKWFKKLMDDKAIGVEALMKKYEIELIDEKKKIYLLMPK